MDFLFGYNENKLKPYFKMASHRLGLLNNKKATASKHAKREISQLLRAEKDEKAEVRVEHVIRDDFTCEAYEILQLFCDLLHERVKFLSKASTCPSEVLEAVCTIIWASFRIDIPEFPEIRKQLKMKYGKEFIEACANGDFVNVRVMHKLDVKPPDRQLIRSYLTEIAKEYDVDWRPAPLNIAEPPPSGYSVRMAPASNLESVYATPPQSMINANDAPPSYEESQLQARHEPSNVVPPPDASPAPVSDNGQVPSFDELAARFAALKDD